MLAAIAAIAIAGPLLAACSSPSAAAVHHRQATVYFASGQNISNPLGLNKTYDWKPHTVYLAGDGTYGIDKAVWLSWSASAAIARGTANITNCNPSCATGPHSYAPVVATFTRPVDACGWHFWSRVALRYPAAVPPGLKRNQVWVFTALISQAHYDDQHSGICARIKTSAP
jgi:hypothetical protein